VLFGTTAGLSSTSNQFFTAFSVGLGGPVDGDMFGAALGAGDFINRDGITDLAIGIPGSPFPRIFINGSLTSSDNKTGAVQMLRGSTSRLLVDSSFTFGDADDQFGSVFAAGDFNGDGRQELAVGVPRRNSRGFDHSGAVFIVGFDRGVPEQIQVFDQDTIFGTGHVAARDLFGFSLASGDFDGDGRSDLAIGVPLKEERFVQLRGGEIRFPGAGEVNVIHGSATGLSLTGHTPQRWNQSLIPNALGTAHDQFFGYSLSAWNFGRNQVVVLPSGARITIRTADLAIGTPYMAVNGAAAAGSVSVLYGSFAAGLSRANAQFWTQGGPPPGAPARTPVPGAPEEGDTFGLSLY
jgi:hypothetical protein